MTTLKLILKTILYRPLYNALMFLVWLIPGHNVGWAIIILTIIIRLILLPPSLKAVRAQRRLRDLQPKIREIQEKYKGDKTKQSQAMMEFYKLHKVNPLGSCLPLLIQFPILIILYYVFINGLNTARFDLLYPFTPRPEDIKTIFLGLDLARPDRFVLPIIAGVLQFIQGWQMMPAKTLSEDQADKGQAMQSMISKQMLYLMPIFTVFIAGRLPAALPLYWAITTLFGIFQQWWVLREKPAAISESPQAVAPIKKSSWLYNRLTKKALKEGETITKKGVEVTVRRKSK
ncbi:MAG: YidC/Oxa1 family membrane protein insertase [Patescibacteria group bacterium]